MPKLIRNSRYVLLALTAVVCLCSLATAQSTDRIRKTKGSETGEIVKMTPLAVTIEKGGASTEVPITDIKSIVFKSEPAELTQARINVSNSSYETALARLESINLAEVRGAYIEQEIQFLKAYSDAKLALVGAKPIREAGVRLNAFVTEHSQNFHYFEATELLGDLLVNMGNYASAQSMYEKLARASWPSYQMRSGVLVGRSLLAQKKFNEALQQYQAVLAIEDDTEEGKQQRLAAELGKAVATAATGDIEAGIQAVEQVIRDADPENARLLAPAYNALGACYEQAGKQKEALYAYLHVDLLYRGVAEAHAEALYHLAPLWKTIGQDGEARRAREALLEQYPASRWAQQAGG